MKKENEVIFIKRLRALKHYCPKSYKFILFNLDKNKLVKEDGIYYIDLPTSINFKFIYGQIKLEYEVRDSKVFYKDIYPQTFFEEGYKRELGVYKNNYFVSQFDKFKIDLMYQLQEANK